MICLNCGRPNPSGTSLCYRCRERRPGLERARGGVIYQRTRETARVKKRGSGILVVGVLLLAGLIFAGGTIAVFLAPKGPTPTNPGIAFNNATPSQLEIFEQITPTPEPTATPWFPSFTPGASPTDLLSFFPSPSGEITLPPPTIPGAITPRPTRPPTATPTGTPRQTPTNEPTPTPTPKPPKPNFTDSQQGTSTIVDLQGMATQDVQQWSWTFDVGGPDVGQNVTHDFNTYGQHSATLTVLYVDGSSSQRTKQFNVQAPPCNELGEPQGCIPTPPPSIEPSPPANFVPAG